MPLGRKATRPCIGRQVNEVQVQLDKMKAETKVMLNQVKQDSKVRVQNTTANGELEVMKLKQQKDALITKVRHV